MSDENILFTFNLDTTSFNQKLVETLNKLDQVKIVVDNSSKSLENQKQRYIDTSNVINNHNKSLEESINIAKKEIELNNQKIKQLEKETKVLGDFNELNVQQKVNIYDSIKALEQKNIKQREAINAIEGTISANKKEINSISDKNILLTQSIKITQEQEIAVKNQQDIEAKRLEQLKQNSLTQLIFYNQIKQKEEETTQAKIKADQEKLKSEQLLAQQKDNILKQQAFQQILLGDIQKNISDKRYQDQIKANQDETRNNLTLQQSKIAGALYFFNQAKQKEEESKQLEIQSNQEKTRAVLQSQQAKIGALLYFFNQAKVLNDQYTQKEQESFSKNLNSFIKNEEEKKQIFQKNLNQVLDSEDKKNKLLQEKQVKTFAKETIKEGSDDLISKTNIALANQKKAREELAEAERKENQVKQDQLKLYSDAIQANNFEIKTIKDKIALLSENIIGKKKLTDAEKEHNDQVNKLLKPLQDELKLLKERGDTLTLGKAKLDNNLISVNTSTAAIQNQAKALAENKKVLDETTKTQPVENFRNKIWELVYALRGLEMGMKSLVGLNLADFGREFDKNLHNADSILLSTSDKLSQFRQGLIEISKDVNYSGLNNLSDAFYHAVSAGFDVAHSLDLVKEADRGALAGLAETSDVLKALVSITHSYGINTYSAAKANDILLKTVQEGVITMPELSRHIGQAVTIAPELGIGLEDVAGAMVAMTRQGLNASESVTALNNIFKTFLDPSKEATKYARELGIELNKSAFETKNLGEVVKDIATRADTDLIGKIFGNIRGVKGFFKLAKDEGDVFIKYIQHQNEAQGAVTKSMERQRESYDQTINRMKNTWEIFTTDIGKSTAENITPAIKFFTDLLKEINELPDPLKKLLAVTIEIIGAIGGLLIASAALSSGFKAIGLDALLAGTGITAFTSSTLAGATGANNLTSALALLKTQLMALATNPLTYAVITGAYVGYQGVKMLNDQSQAKETEKYNADIITESKKEVERLQGLIEKGKKLSIDEKELYAHALITSTTPQEQDYKAKKELALSLMQEVKAVQQTEQAKKDLKEKMTTLEANQNAKIRQDFIKNEEKMNDDILKAKETTGQTRIRHVKKEYDDQIKIAKDALGKLKIESDKGGLIDDAFTKDRYDKALDYVKALEKAKAEEVAKVTEEEKEKALAKEKDRLEKISKDEYKSRGYDKSLADLNTEEKKANLKFTKTGNTNDLDQDLANIEAKRVKIYQGIKNNVILTKEVRDNAGVSLIDSQIALENKLIKVSENAIEQIKNKYQKARYLIQSQAKLTDETSDITNTKLIKENLLEISDIKDKLAEKDNHLSFKRKQELKYELEQKDTENKELQKQSDIEVFEKTQLQNKRLLDLEKEKHKESIALGTVSLETKLQYNREELNAEIESKTKDLEFYKNNAKKKGEIQQALAILIIQENNLIAKQNKDLLKDQEELAQRFYNQSLGMLESNNKLKLGNDLSYLQNKLRIESDYLSKIQDQENNLKANNRYVDDRGDLTTEAKAIQDKRIQFENEIKLLKFNIYQEEIKQEDEIQKKKMDNLSSYIKMLGDLGSKLSNSKNFGNIGNFFSSGSKDIENLLSKINPLRDQLLAFGEMGAKLNEINKQSDEQFALSFSGKTLEERQKAQVNFTNLVNASESLQKDLEKAQGLMTASAIQEGIQEIINSFGKFLEVTDKVSLSLNAYSRNINNFGKESEQAKNSQKDFIASQMEMIKIIPFLGDSLSNLSRMITDSTGLTTSEAQKTRNDNILKLQHELNTALLNTNKESVQNNLDIENENYNNKLQELNKEILTDKEYALKSELLATEHQNSLNKILQDGFNKALDIQSSYEESAMGLTKGSFENQKKLLDQKFFNDFMKLLQNVPKDAEGQQLWLKQQETLTNNFYTDLQKLETENNSKTLNLRSGFINSEIALLKDNSAKQLAIAENSKNEALRILDEEQTKKFYTQEQYELKQKTILNQYQLDKNKVFTDLYNKMYTDQTAKLKSEYQKQLDIISNYEQAKKDLIENRDRSALEKQNRANQLKIDLASARNTANTTGGFFTMNELDFTTGNGLTTGNDTLRRKADQDFAEGLISYQDMLDKKKQLALEKRVFYEQKLAVYKDPQKRVEIQAKIDEATNEYYNNVFDKEQEKLDLDKQNAEKKLTYLKDEIDKRTEEENKFIAKMNQNYDNSADYFSSTMKKGTVDWIDFTQKKIDGLVFNTALNNRSTVLTPNQQQNAVNTTSLFGETPISNRTLQPLSSTDINNINSSPPDTIPMYIPMVGWVDMPLHAKGGVTNGMGIAGEKGSEAIFNYPSMKKMYDYMTGDLYKVNNNNQSIIYSPNININGVQLQSDSNIIDIASKITNNQIKALKDNISNNQYSRR